MKYVIIDYSFCGKVDWETEDTISVNGGGWAKSRVHIKRIGFFKYKLHQIINSIYEWIYGEDL